MNTRAPSSIALPWKLAALFSAVALLAIAYTVYWFLLANRFEEELATIKGTAQEDGLIAEWESLSFSGFPYRLALNFDGASLSRGRGDVHWTWTAPHLTVQMLPYKLHHAIADFAGEQNLYLAGPEGVQQITFGAEAFWASHVRLDGGSGRTAFETRALAANAYNLESGEELGALGAALIQMNTRPAPDAENGSHLPGTYDLALKTENLAWTFAPLVPWLERDISHAELQLRIDNLPARLPADADDGLRDWAARGGKLAISHVKLLWGPVDLEGRGELTLDARGRPQGRFETSFGNPDALFERLVEAGIVKREAAPMVFAGVSVLSALQGRPQDGRAHLPLVFQDGVAFLGPVAIARLEPVY